METRISRAALIEDIRQLTEIIETAHPDPYSRGGGRIAYHRRLQKLIRGIPPAGMTAHEFNLYLMPFVAGIKDGHTTVLDEKTLLGEEHPGGIPLIFGAIEEQLYVRAVVHQAHKGLIGSLLVSVAGIAVDELLQRVERLFGCENQYQTLGKLGNRPALLFYKDTLALLIPEWQPGQMGSEITVELRSPDGELQTHVFDTRLSDAPAQIKVESPAHLPPLTDPNNPHFFYQFVDETGRTPGEIAVLRIADMGNYREAFEYFNANGWDHFEGWGTRVFQRFNPDADVPNDYAQVIAGIPAASTTFRDLVSAMKAAQTRFLIVDLRDNQGGNDMMNHILTYYLVGFEKTVALLGTKGTVRKLSEFLASISQQGIDLTQIPYSQQVPLNNTDYDFSLDPGFSGEEYERSIRADLERNFARIPSFYPEFQSREHEALYCPEQMFILCSELTFSSGYDLMASLFQLGGQIVGIPSGAAGNSCGDVHIFQLDNSAIKGQVSTKFFITFPNDPASGTLLRPQYPLTYDRFKAYDFDENASLRYALDLIVSSK